MNKRIFSLVLALVLALASLTVAFAESSATAAVVTIPVVKSMVSSTGVVLPADFLVTPVEETLATQALAKDIAAAITAGSLETVFGEEAVALIDQAVLGLTTVSALKVQEVFPMTVVNYSAAYGDVAITLELPTEYAANDIVVVVIGYVDAEGNQVWVVVDVEIVDGDLVITLPVEALSAAVNADLTCVILGA